MKAGFQPQSSIFKERGNNLIGNDLLIMGRWKQYFYETVNVKVDVEIREESYTYLKGKLTPNRR
jgi:hypothetical protein